MNPTSKQQSTILPKRLRRSDELMEYLIKVAENNEEKEQAYRVRYKVYAEEKRLFVKERFPDKQFRDKFDNYASQIIAVKDDKVYGAVRIIEGNEKTLPIEEDFEIERIKMKGKVIEASKLAILAEVRFKQVALGIFRGVYRFAKRCNAFGIVIVSFLNMENLYLHLNFKKIGRPFFFRANNCYMLPMFLNIHETEEYFRLKHPRLYRYFVLNEDLHQNLIKNLHIRHTISSIKI
jgi:N-acyl-L-homoserine lactone synthetase